MINHVVCLYCHLFDVYCYNSGHIHALILCLFLVGHRGDDEHCSKWAEGARTAEFSEIRPWCCAGHPGADEECSHTGQLHRVPEPTPRPPAAAHYHGATHAPQHQRYHEHFQARRCPAHGGAAQAPRPAAQTHGGGTQDGSGAVSGGPSTGSSGQTLHYVIHCGPKRSGTKRTAVRARFIVDLIANKHGDGSFLQHFIQRVD